MIDKKIQEQLLYKMLKIRILEEEIAKRYSEWKMRCPTHLSIGQEAVASAVCACLDTKDFAVSTHRAHGHYIAKGGSINQMIAEIYGKSTGCSGGKGGSMHLIDESVGFMGSTAIVGNTIPIGVGLGLSISLKQSNQVSCVFFGDGAVEEGAFYESVNLKKKKKLPVLFLCENNFYSVYSPLKVRQPQGRSIAEMVKGLGLPSDSGDGNDVEEVYIKTNKAVEQIRTGFGPFFLEFFTYRWREHCGPNYDNDIGYRTEEEYLNWKEKDPVETYKNKLIQNGWSKKECMSLEDNIFKEIQKAFEFAENSPFPEQKEAYTQEYKVLQTK